MPFIYKYDQNERLYILISRYYFRDIGHLDVKDVGTVHKTYTFGRINNCLPHYLLFSEPVIKKTMPVGIAYGIWGGLGIVLIIVIGAVFFKQTPDVPAIIGIGLIVAGVVVVNVFSKMSVH